MDKIFIFSGTSEGRELSEALCDNGIKNRVFVATEYGEVVMTKNDLCQISQGRMTREEMVAEFKKEKPDRVFDATHPYAVEVSENIKGALEEAGLGESYVRVSRELPLTESLLREDYDDVEIVLSTEEAVEYLKTTRGNILLTTGVKTLKEYTKEPLLKDRIIARILPSRESLDMAYEAGLLPHQIIAMEGPFLTSLNEAMLDQYRITTLVTKNSGAKGGFLEKLEACKNKRVKPLVIDIGKKNEGITLEEAKKLLGIKKKSKIKAEGSYKKKKISIVGIGAGNESTMTVAARTAIKEATLLIGADRMIEIGRKFNTKADAIIEYMPDEVLKLVDASSERKIAFLVSGDTGFYSGATAVKAALAERDYVVRVFPGVSSVAYFASLIGLSYSGAAVVSLHGRDCNMDKVLSENKKVFAIVSGNDDIKVIVDKIQATGRVASVYVGYNLGLDDEEIIDFMSDNPRECTKKGLYVVGVVFHE